MEKFLEQAELMSKFWTDLASRMAAAGLSMSPGTAPPEAAKQMRTAFFQAMAQSLDEFMRSPQFLEMMKQSMDAAIAWRRQANEWLTQWHHELQSTASQDIDSLMLALRQMETRVLDRVEEIGRRVDELAGRLDALDGASRSNGTGPARRTAGSAARKGPRKQDQP